MCLLPLLSAQQEEKAIAEGVMVRDAWDGSIQDIELEVTGLQRQQFTEEQERAAVESAVSACARVGGGAVLGVVGEAPLGCPAPGAACCLLS